MKSLSIITKLKILFTIKLLVGTIMIIFLDIILGILILIAGVITIIYLIKIKTEKFSKQKQLVAQLHIIIGILMLIGAVVFFTLYQSINDIRVIIKTIIGFILLIKGGYEMYKSNRKVKEKF
ncbi:MAG: DUF308 domain-containing protein [Nanoarchaeota archaeon]|nr:DUF308 domain-containing protein [Nanoarchaeota archaeon]